MVKLMVLYGPPEDAAAFEEHYANTHVPLAAKMPHVERFEAGRVIGTPDGGDSPYHRIAELWFDSAEDLQAAAGSDEGQATTGDIPTFATGGATLLIVDVD